jgi:hypothetical protein
MNISLPLGNPAPSRSEIASIGKALRSVKKGNSEDAHDEPPPPPKEDAPIPCPKHENACALDCTERVPF